MKYSGSGCVQSDAQKIANNTKPILRNQVGYILFQAFKGRSNAIEETGEPLEDT